MLTEEQVAEMQACAAETIKCENCSRYDVVDCLGSVRRALLADRAELQAEIERLRAVVEAARPVIEWAREHWSDGLLTDEDQARCGEAYRAYAALAALEGEA